MADSYLRTPRYRHRGQRSLSPEEVRDALDGLSAEDHSRLMKAAAVYSSGLPEEPADLLQEAMCRTLSGQRVVPARMEVTPFLIGVMRSLSSSARKRIRQGRLISLEDAPPVAADWDGEERGGDRLLALFELGSRERQVLRMKLDGRRGAEIREPLRLSRIELASSLRAIRRRLERAKRGG